MAETDSLSRYAYSDACIKNVREYIKAVDCGEIKVGRAELYAVRRHLNDLKRPQSKKFPYIFDEYKADRVFQFFSLLRHSKGEWSGKQFMLSDWQAFIIWSLFGWVNPEDGYRRFRIAYIQIARKNGKTTFAAGVSLYLLMRDGESGAEVFSYATTRDQAKICFDESVRMAKQSLEIKKNVDILGGKRPNRINYDKRFSFMSPLSSDADTLDGLNPHGAIIDELHAHKTDEGFEVINTGTGARRQSLIFAITTAGSNQQSVCYEQREHSLKILQGFKNNEYVDDAYFAFIAEMDKKDILGAPDDDEWTDPDNFRKGNPNLGISVRVDELLTQCKRAEQAPSMQNQFRQKRLNEWVAQSARFINMALWHKLPTNRLDLTGRPCFAGLDLSTTIDLTALVLVFPPLNDSEPWAFIPRFWVPDDRVREVVRERRIPYDRWRDSGDLKTTPGNIIDYEHVRNEINALAQLYSIKEIGYDPYNANWIIPKLEADGFEMVKMRQGVATLHAPTKYLESLIISQNLNPGKNAVLTWNASNVSVYRDSNGNMKPTRENDSLKIDGIVAAIMGLGRAIAAADYGASGYQDGVLILG